MLFAGKKYMLSHLVKLLQINQGLHDKDQHGAYILYPNVERYSVDLSHLCHQPQCVNPFHLIFELRKANLGRAMCAKLKKCQQNHDGPNCLINTESHPLVLMTRLICTLQEEDQEKILPPKITVRSHHQ
jgi:hypothetical protein